MIPGSVMTLTPESCTVAHPMPDDEVSAIFTDKRAYLEAMRERRRPEIDGREGDLDARRDRHPAGAQGVVRTADPAGRPDGRGDQLPRPAQLRRAQPSVVLDFRRRRVRAWHGETCEYRLFIDPALVETCIKRHDEDWVNQIFLSCRFEAERDGPYNEYVYSFFKCLSPERIQYAEGFYSSSNRSRRPGSAAATASSAAART